MQKGNSDRIRKMRTSVEIVDVPPAGNEEEISKADELSAGSTQLTLDEVRRLFQSRNLAYIGTLSKDGSPHVTPVWAEMIDELILINTFESSAKNKHVTKDKRIALSIVEQSNPYCMFSIEGTVIDQTSEGADEHLKRLAQRYLGIGKYYYRKPHHKRMIIKIKPEKIMGLSIHPAFYFLGYTP
jgi:PPOX class probable F420-dependent enzyme